VTPALRRAGIGDASALAAFAARTFGETFGADNTPEDMAEYLAAAYGESQQGREIESADIITLVMEHEGAIGAYAQIRRGSTLPACVTTPRPVELWRFYVDRSWQGRGVARALMDGAYEAARELGGLSLWLSVWERNERAIAFYAKCGFTDAGTKVFMVGSDRQTDRVYVRSLSPSSTV
jgi:diamine N-acetyltransferase